MTDREEIEAAINSFIASYNSGDLNAVLDSYDDSLIKLRQGATPETKSELARRLAQVFESFRTRVEVLNQEIEVGGDLAFARGRFRVTLTPRAGGEGRELQRRYLEIWRKRAGRWRVARTMDNTAEESAGDS
jgi:ketosteroid isomerase-like protein